MKCPECGARCGVIDSRSAEKGTVRRRRYRCPRDHRFTTFERQDSSPYSECKMYRQRANASVAREQQVRRELNRVRARLRELEEMFSREP